MASSTWRQNVGITVVKKLLCRFVEINYPYAFAYYSVATIGAILLN